MCFSEVDKTYVYAFGMLPEFLENLLESGNSVCSAMATTKTALGIIQFWFNYYCDILVYTSWETKQRDSAVVGSFIPVSFFVYGDDQFTNLSMPLQNAMTLDTHESAKPSGVQSSLSSLSNFSRLALSSDLAAASEGLLTHSFTEAFICARSKHPV